LFSDYCCADDTNYRKKKKGKEVGKTGSQKKGRREESGYKQSAAPLDTCVRRVLMVGF
jgi:hypothetical protein